MIAFGRLIMMKRISWALLCGLISFTGLAVASEETALSDPFVISGSRVMPAYPPAALAASFEARVTVAALINEDGSIGVVEVVDTTRPNLGFEEAALGAIKQWRFAPATLDDKPVMSVWAYTFCFDTAGGQLRPSPYVSGEFVASTPVAPGTVVSKDSISETTAASPRHRSAVLHTPRKIPCRTLGCMYDRRLLLAPPRTEHVHPR
jgi:TonB family protein